MKLRWCARRYNQATIRDTCEGRDSALNLGSVLLRIDVASSSPPKKPGQRMTKADIPWLFAFDLFLAIACVCNSLCLLWAKSGHDL
jgi:hypothetical protein